MAKASKSGTAIVAGTLWKIFMTMNALRNNTAASTGEFNRFRDFLEEACGISLGENKQYLVNTRIRRILSEHSIDSLTTLIERLKIGRDARLREQVIDAMTTNETFWFRDNYPYEYLKNTIFPSLNQTGERGEIRIWSAACSSGQEPYSISIIYDEFKRRNMSAGGRPLKIVATDLSSAILAQARSGEYDKLSVMRGLSQDRLMNYFNPVNDDTWKVKSEIGRHIEFRPINLMDSFMGLGRFDVVFCRNVLIYFTADLKRDILRRIHATLKPGGLLFLGSSEGLAGISDLFEMVNCNPGILYRAK